MAGTMLQDQEMGAQPGLSELFHAASQESSKKEMGSEEETGVMEAEVREKSLRDGRCRTAGSEDGGRGLSQGGGALAAGRVRSPQKAHEAHDPHCDSWPSPSEGTLCRWSPGFVELVWWLAGMCTELWAALPLWPSALASFR